MMPDDFHPASSGDIEQLVINNDLKSLIILFTGQLTPKQKLVFTLSEIEDLSLEYHLTFPGKVFLTNAGWNRGDTLIWKIDPIRLYASENYRLTAESRKTNTWAFIVTFLVGLSTFVFFIRQKKVLRHTFDTPKA